MNSVVVLILGFIVAFLGYRVYAKYIDAKIIKSDPKRATPAKMYMDGVEFMPTNRNVLFGYQFKSIAGATPIIGPIIAIQWGWLPALIWILVGAFFIGWVQDYASMMVAMRNDGASFGGLSHKLISPRARVINWFHEFGIPVGGVIVNGLIQKEQTGADTIEFVRNRIKMQEEHMKEIWEIFGDRVRAIAPLLETEIKGAKMLNRTIDYLFVPER